MSELLKRTDRLWSGEASTTQADFHPFSGPRLLEELAPGVAFFKAFVNVTAVKTGVRCGKEKLAGVSLMGRWPRGG